jgi:uncharacterized protein
MNATAFAPNNVFIRPEEPSLESPPLRQPTTLRERISSIDVLRGYALEAGALAIVAAVMITIKCGVLGSFQRALAAVRQTALTNYLLTTVICRFIFLWSPWKLYGKLEYYQLEYVVFFVWAINLIVSPIWLRMFQFGPVEWLWRSLTYVKLQPMLKRRSA